MQRFDLLGPLPARGSTTVLEASAGTGKTFALAALVTRYLAEGVATLDQMLLITFSRAATRELRDRVRAHISDTAAALCDPAPAHPNELVAHLRLGTAADREERHRRLRDALADFDAATIATTHEFCSIVLKSLGVAGDTDTGVTLVEDLDDLVVQIVDDLYLERFGSQHDETALPHTDALALARAVVGDPCAELSGKHLGAKADAEVGLVLLQRDCDPVDLPANPVVRIVGAHRATKHHQAGMIVDGGRQRVAKRRSPNVE
jgi:exodeoxyribonuclease V beta subunit